MTVPRLLYGIHLGSSEVGWRFAGASRWATPVDLASWATSDMDDAAFLEAVRSKLMLLGAPKSIRFQAFNRPVAPRFILAADAIHGRSEDATEVGAHRLILGERRHRAALAETARILATMKLAPTEKPGWLLCAD